MCVCVCVRVLIDYRIADEHNPSISSTCDWATSENSRWSRRDSNMKTKPTHTTCLLKCTLCWTKSSKMALRTRSKALFLLKSLVHIICPMTCSLCENVVMRDHLFNRVLWLETCHDMETIMSTFAFLWIYTIRAWRQRDRAAPSRWISRVVLYQAQLPRWKFFFSLAKFKNVAFVTSLRFDSAIASVGRSFAVSRTVFSYLQRWLSCKEGMEK